MNNEMLNSMLLQTYFGFSDCDLNDEETLIAKCCDRAYKDMCRTLRFNKAAEATVYKDRWKDQVSNVVVEAIRNIDPDSVAFDGYHETTCKNMMEVSCEGVFDNEELHYGQAQKWFNMTCKYLYLLNYWENEQDLISTVLHAPVDNYIIQIATTNNTTVPDCKFALGIESSDMPSAAWSRWDSIEYKCFQKKLRERLDVWNEENSSNLSLIDWECYAWVEQARIESNR